MSGWKDAIARLDAVSQAHATSPVPAGEQVAGYRISLVGVAIAFTLSSLYIGATLVESLGLAGSIWAVIWGSVILAVMSVPAAMVGSRTRLSTYMVVMHVFGRAGARSVNFVLAVVLLGWYAVTDELFGRTCYLTVGQYLPGATLPQWVYTVACSIVVMATTIYGFKAIERLSLWVAPLLVVLTTFVAWRSLHVMSWAHMMALPGTHMDLSRGISAVIGGMIVNVVLMPDITRYARTTFDCVMISVTGNAIGGGLALFLAMLPALAFAELDPMRYMFALHLAGIAFTTLVVSTWSINVVNLYSTGLVTSTSLPHVSYGRIVIGCGVVGTLLAVLGIANRLIDFLVFLGLIVPPIAAVYIVDFFLLRRTDYTASIDHPGLRRANVSGVCACAAGAALGILMYLRHDSLTGVPTIESFVIASLLYVVLEKARGALGRDRAWRRQVA